jgi:acyl-CoA reductase-like NAD-dependent aldehyde dehydrogenase
MAAARDRRARATGGRRRRLLRRPTVFSDVRSDMTIAQEEIFGPVLAVMPYDTEEEAIEIANGTSYGLSGGVWSGDPKRAQRRELTAALAVWRGPSRSRARAYPGCSSLARWSATTYALLRSTPSVHADES